MADPVVKLVDIVRSFKMGDTEVHALQGVSVTVERGEFVAIMGSSGSGKSTMMNLIGCLDRPTSGQYFFEGRDVAKLSENELADIRGRRIGFVFQNFNLLAALDVFLEGSGDSGLFGEVLADHASFLDECVAEG